MRVLITGSNGFIGKNLLASLKPFNEIEVDSYLRGQTIDSLKYKLTSADLIVHLAGVNRPKHESEFKTNNIQLTEIICNFIFEKNINSSLIMSSSSQAVLDNPYGKSKHAAEEILKKLSMESGNPVAIFRLPGVFGKWCKPNYNSVIATFCHNIANNIPIKVDDSSKLITLVYIDDVVNEIINLINLNFDGIINPVVRPVYKVNLGDIANQIQSFKKFNDTIILENIDPDFARALYSTYLSYLS